MNIVDYRNLERLEEDGPQLISSFTMASERRMLKAGWIEKHPPFRYRITEVGRDALENG